MQITLLGEIRCDALEKKYEKSFHIRNDERAKQARDGGGKKLVPNETRSWKSSSGWFASMFFFLSPTSTRQSFREAFKAMDNVYTVQSDPGDENDYDKSPSIICCRCAKRWFVAKRRRTLEWANMDFFLIRMELWCLFTEIKVCLMNTRHSCISSCSIQFLECSRSTCFPNPISYSLIIKKHQIHKIRQAMSDSVNYLLRVEAQTSSRVRNFFIFVSDDFPSAAFLP